MRIFENQTEEEFAIVNENLRAMIAPLKENSSTNFIFFGKKANADVQYANGVIISMIKGRTVYDFRETFKLHGYHNIENLMSVIAVAELFDIHEEHIYHALSEFEGLEHRLEFVDTIDDITFINDSKATNVDSAIKAIKSMEDEIILIAGGKDKKFSFKPLAEAAKNRVKAIVLIGEAAERMGRAFESWSNILYATTMDDAVEAAYEIANSGDTVLLSPACSSFDMFSGYEERGEVFRNSVRQLKMRLEHITGQ